MNKFFEFIKQTIPETSDESDFLSIQHLLYSIDDIMLKLTCYRLLEECILQVVLQKNDCETDFKHNKSNVKPLTDVKVEKSKQDKDRVSNGINKLKEVLRTKQACMAKLIQGKLPQMPSSLNFSGNTVLSASPLPPSQTSFGFEPPTPPPSPPMSDFKYLPSTSESKQILLQMERLSTCQTPSNVLPYGMEPKKKYVLKTPLKRAHWTKIPLQKMSEKSFWVSVHEEKLASEDIFETLSARFSFINQVKKENNGVKYKQFKKVKELKVLDAKAARNLSILLGSVRKSPKDILQYVLRIDEEKLTDAMLQQLKYMPDSSQLSRLEEFKDQYNELDEAEKFALTMGSIKRLEPRLKSISFKMGFQENVKDIKSDMDAVTGACKELIESKKFHLILKIILLIGNYMNAGSRNEQTFGFEINFLTKLNSTKAADHETTLLNYIVEIVDNKYQDALNFADELANIEKAARASSKQIQNNFSQMKQSVKEVETELKNFSPYNEEDRFKEVMTAFLKEATEACEILEKKFKKMEKLSEDLSIYYAFDPKEYTFAEFFCDIKTFKDMFQIAYKENLRARELEEKMLRGRDVKEKAQMKKQEILVKEKKTKEEQSANSSKNQEDITDSLLALKDQTFSKTRRKTRTRERRNRLNIDQSRSCIPTQHNDRENLYVDSRNREVTQ